MIYLEWPSERFEGEEWAVGCSRKAKMDLIDVLQVVKSVLFLSLMQ